jgi:ribosomal protein S18 acetylase RimI-like enzyme
VFTDGESRQIRMRTYERRLTDFDALVDMYAVFGPDDRAQGLPPMSRGAIGDWLAQLDGTHVVAFHGATPVGHAVLAPPESETVELAVFVRPSYQNASVGTNLLEELLARGAAVGVREVYLHVERSNRAAIALYRSYGFTVEAERAVELRMRRSTGDADAR